MKPISLTYNERRIVSSIRSAGMQSRADLARGLGVTPPTITRLINKLISLGLLVEQKDKPDKRKIGYPSKLLRIEPTGLYTAGVFIDPDHIYTCLCDLSGSIIAQDTLNISDRSFENIMTLAGHSVAEHVSGSGIDPAKVAGVGVSYPGAQLIDSNRVFRIKQFADWPNIDVNKDLAPFFEFPVSHMNDAKAAGLAELYYGACRTLDSFCLVWLSYGIGGAAVIDHRLYLGSNKDAAEFGGLFPKSQPRPSGQDLMDSLRNAGMEIRRLSDIGDAQLELPVAQEWMARSTEQLRWLCLMITRTFAPQSIVFGGTLPKSMIDHFVAEIGQGKSMGEDFEGALPSVVRATEDGSPQLGAAALPIYQLFSPSTFSGQATKGR